MTVRCIYSCSLCGLTRIPVDVAARKPGEDILHWMESVAIPTLSADHASRSSGCHPSTLHEVMIPMGAGNVIGAPPKN